MKISATIITFNEEKNIEDAIRSVDWADEILIVDSESTDRTREIAMGLGARVITNPWPGFAKQKQFAVDNAQFDWIFSLDADERVTEALRDEILAIKEADHTTDGYKIPRLSIYMGREIRHGGWYPNWQLRFFDRTKGRWKDVLIHVSVQMSPEAKVGTLKHDILHYSVESPAHHHKMIGERYAPLAAKQMFEGDKRTSPLAIVFRAWFAFVQTYFLKAGFLDGFPGFCIAYFASHHTFMKYLMLYEMQRK
ncbi:MAG TPA: glycosyltransferase family 2 protein [Pyrinomonadaceae bacterium]|nr:glycosyltransferase family 2 protein [Pyrinomonadaceae bacterium]